MKIERTDNATRNITFGVLLKIYQMAAPFLLRTALIYYMGAQYVGLDSLFASILQVLNLAELGVGSAMVYSMYKPIVEDDTITICALMKLYRLYYRIIGSIIAVVGVVLTPFVPTLVKGNLPAELNIYVLYLLNLFATVLSYWAFAYKSSVFQAHQRVDVISKINIVTFTFRYVGQLLVILFIKDYYIYILVMLVTQLLTNVITAIAASKMYPEYQPRGSLDKKSVKDINQRIKDLFTSKIGSVVVNSADSIVISAFLGLTILAIYQNYYFIMTSIIGLIAIVFQACTAGIGNSVIVETKEKNFVDLKNFTFLISWIGGFCACCFLCLYQPFMKVWMGDKYMLEFSAVVCFCVYFFVYEINQLLNTYKDAAGIWHEDRFRPLVTAAANLCLNLLLVQYWGVYGVLLSTVISMLLIGMPWLLYNLFTVLFERKYFGEYFKLLLKYSLIVFLSCVLCYLVCNVFSFGAWPTLIIRGAICCILPNVFFFIIYRKTTEFQQCLGLLDRITRGKIKFLKNRVV